MPRTRLSRFLALFTVNADNMALARAQYAAFSKQIPLLYFILTSSSMAAAVTFTRFAPPWMSVYLPVALCTLCLTRCLWWWRTRKRVLSDAQVLRYMRLTTRLAVILTFSFTVWGLALYPYGDAYARGQIVFCMAMTVIGCVFCLMHLRPAALLVTIFANTPFILFFFFEGHASLRAIAVNLALVSVAMIVILMVYSRDFARLVASQAETRRLSDENFKVANLDSLTALPNRRWFFANLAKHFERAQREERRLAIGIIDLDGFKPVNDTYGHATGDRLLAEVGDRLRGICGDVVSTGISLCRMGGDEFAILLTKDVSDVALKGLGRRIADTLRLPYTIGSAQAQIGSSIGFAIYPDNATNPETLFERADYALYFAKRHARGGTVLFTAEHEAQIRSDSVIEQALQSANLEAELSMVFQPIIETRTQGAVAFEALARWGSPTLGPVNPAVFIPAAERIGLIHNVTRILLGKALREAARWPEHVRLSFNLSANDLCSTESIVAIIAAVNRSDVSARRIDFEITETAVAHDFDAARAGIDALKALGAGISLDDFGTGFSSLSHVHRLPLDKLKVDRSFVQDICDNPASFKIVKSLAALCLDMGLTCIVEGVETAEQFDLLSGLGCAMVQGYYFARPMQASEVSGYLGLQDAATG